MRQAGSAAADRERGSATIWVLGLLTVVLVLGAAGATVAGAISVRHRAASAADLAALAGARLTTAGPDVACTAARRVALASGVRLSRCLVAGSDIEVTVELQAAALRLAGVGPARAWARAGPAPVAVPGP